MNVRSHSFDRHDRAHRSRDPVRTPERAAITRTVADRNDRDLFTVGASLALFAWRAPRVGLGGRFELVSKESLLLMNNVLLTVAAAAVLLGTLYPLVLDALNLGKISVGPPYFDTVFVPLMAPALFLMGIGPLARWREASLPSLARRLKWAFGLAVVCALVLPALLGEWTAMRSFGLLLAFGMYFPRRTIVLPGTAGRLQQASRRRRRPSTRTCSPPSKRK